VAELVSGIGVSIVRNNENYHHEETRLTVDVYHHFDVKTEELITELIKFFKGPIEIEITNNTNVPTKITLIPGEPQTNK
jgi:hypothetical protein